MNSSVLLLNPPGRKPYLRDYYCSKISKFDYLYHPVDLVMMSGTLQSAGFEVGVLDALAEKINPDECLKKIRAANPSAIIFLAGFVSWPEDRAFLKRIKDETGALLCGSGDLFMGRESFYESCSFIDAFITDFTTNDIALFLQGRYDAIESMVFRRGRELIFRSSGRQSGQYRLPAPLHHLFRSSNYRYPFVRHAAFATVLTDYGCPFRCRFCIMSGIAYRVRPVEDILEELALLKGMGVKEIYFSDQTFGVSGDRIRALCSAMIDRQWKLGWVCFFRVDLVTDEIIATMRRAGCHTIMLGIETASQPVLDTSGKGTSTQQTLQAIAICKKRGIRVIGTFLIGLPDDDERSIRRTIDFSLRCGLAYASYNTLVPRPCTPLWDLARQQGLTEDALEGMDQSGETAILNTKHIAREAVKQLRDEAYARFYGRPAYMLKRLAGIRTWYDLGILVRGGWGLLPNIFLHLRSKPAPESSNTAKKQA